MVEEYVEKLCFLTKVDESYVREKMTTLLNLRVPSREAYRSVLTHCMMYYGIPREVVRRRERFYTIRKKLLSLFSQLGFPCFS